MDAFFVHPSDGAHAAVIMWPDIAGLRPGYMMMARTLAARGFAVLAVNHYYRNATAPVMESISEFFTPEGRQRLGPMIQAITLDGIASDANAIVKWLDEQDAVDSSKKMGAEGYCMTGSYAIRTAAAVPSRVGAVSSFHGGGLVAPGPTSPHRLFNNTTYYLIAIAKNDDENAPNDKNEIRLAAEQAGAGVRIEVFQGDHGWCAVDSAAYHEIEANRAREMSIFHYDKL
jgi:carboxymethylenebutenolidase